MSGAPRKAFKQDLAFRGILSARAPFQALHSSIDSIRAASAFGSSSRNFIISRIFSDHPAMQMTDSSGN